MKATLFLSTLCTLLIITSLEAVSWKRATFDISVFYLSVLGYSYVIDTSPYAGSKLGSGIYLRMQQDGSFGNSARNLNPFSWRFWPAPATPSGEMDGNKKFKTAVTHPTTLYYFGNYLRSRGYSPWGTRLTGLAAFYLKEATLDGSFEQKNAVDFLAAIAGLELANLVFPWTQGLYRESSWWQKPFILILNPFAPISD